MTITPYLSFLWSLLGIWLMAAPAVFGYVGTAAATNDRMVGPFVAAFFVISFNGVTRNIRFWNVPLGLWMIVASVTLDYPSNGMVSAAVTGLAILAVPFVPRRRTQHFGGGWTVIWKRDPYDVAHGSADAPGDPSGGAGHA